MSTNPQHLREQADNCWLWGKVYFFHLHPVTPLTFSSQSKNNWTVHFLDDRDEICNRASAGESSFISVFDWLPQLTLGFWTLKMRELERRAWPRRSVMAQRWGSCLWRISLSLAIPVHIMIHMGSLYARKCWCGGWMHIGCVQVALCLLGLVGIEAIDGPVARLTKREVPS